MSKLLYCEGQYQLDLTLRALAFLRSKHLIPSKGEGVVLDIGANNGVISVGMLVRNEVSAAVGIEPDPINYALLKRNILENDLAARYTALCVAASDRSADLPLKMSRDNFGDHRIQLSDNSEPSEAVNGIDKQSVLVPARSIDELVETLTDDIRTGISLVWIDVQGHEGYVFRGGARLFSRNVPVIAEIWPWGIRQSGMSVEQFCWIAIDLWPYYWSWRRHERFVQYPTTNLIKFCEETGDQEGDFDDVIFANA